MAARPPTKQIAGRPLPDFWPDVDFYPDWIEYKVQKLPGKEMDRSSKPALYTWRCSLEGSCSVTFNNRHYLLTRDTVLITTGLGEGSYQWSGRNLRWRGISIVLGQGGAGEAAKFMLQKHGPVQKIGANPRCIPSALKLVQLLRTRKSSASEWSMACYEWFLSWMSDVAQNNQSLARSLEYSPQDVEIAFFKAGNLKSFAEAVGYSQGHLSRKLRQSWGGSPRRILLVWRMKRAGHLLKTSSMDLKEVANDSGYNSVAAFSRAFKNWYRCTPMLWRNEIRGG